MELLRRRWIRRLAVLCAELFVIAGAGAWAFLLRFDFAIPGSMAKYLWWGLAVWIPVKLLVFRLTGLDRGWGRFASVHEAIWIALGTLGGRQSAPR